jgi:thiamine biosynthesis protein ThiS
MLVNGEQHVLEPMSVTALVQHLGIEARGIAVARNGEIIRRSEWGSTTLMPEDHVEIVSAAAGGA